MFMIKCGSCILGFYVLAFPVRRMERGRRLVIFWIPQFKGYLLAAQDLVKAHQNCSEDTTQPSLSYLEAAATWNQESRRRISIYDQTPVLLGQPFSGLWVPIEGMDESN